MSSDKFDRIVSQIIDCDDYSPFPEPPECYPFPPINELDTQWAAAWDAFDSEQVQAEHRRIYRSRIVIAATIGLLLAFLAVFAANILTY